MIDIENRVIDGIGKLVQAEFPGAKVYSTHINSPPVFPCVMAYESSNAMNAQTCDELGEHHANLGYTIEIYTNDAQGKKQKAKAISSAIDAYMIGLGFLRTSKHYTVGTNESTVFASTCTYSCIAGESYSGDANQIMIYRR